MTRLSDVMAEYPGIVFQEPSIAVLHAQVKQLCCGSPFERAAAEHYFERALREKTGATGIEDRWIKQQNKTETALVAKCVEELKPEYARTATAAEINSLATHRHGQVRDTVTQFVVKSLELLDTFCVHTEKLAGQVRDVYARDFEAGLDPKIDDRIKAWFRGKPEGVTTAVFKDGLFDREATVSDLEEEGQP